MKNSARSSALPTALPAALPYAAAALGWIVPLVMLALARSAGGPFAFPVDDAWIHLQYARNLADHGAFTYFAGDPATTGSTAPLFTLLEALAFKLTRNEFAIGLGLGLAAHGLFLWVLARWASRRLGHPGWAALAVACVALDGRFGMLAASGMETSLFLAGVALAFLAWSEDNALAAGVAIALTTWVRPDALLLTGVFAIDAAIARRAPRRWRAGLVALAAIVAAYGLFNRATGGAAFPNTLAAKAAFYAGRPFGQFLHDDLGATFSAAWLVLLPCAIAAAAVGLLRRLRGGQAGTGAGPVSLAEAGWLVALPLAYAVVLPFSHRFNRYLVPALPALAIAGTAGLRTLIGTWRAAPRGAVAVAGAVLLLGMQAAFFFPSLAEYGEISRYQGARHVRAGRWLAEHTSADAVVAAHDVGAIAFYSNRRVVDMVGLVSPEVVPHLNRPDYLPFLERWFDERHVTHLAVLEEWQPVDNQLPVFEADPDPEVLHIYQWRPGVTHLLEPEVAANITATREALAARDLAGAETHARRAVAGDSLASSAWVALGAVESAAGRIAEAETAFQRAVTLFPGSSDAKLWFDRLRQAPRPTP